MAVLWPRGPEPSLSLLPFFLLLLPKPRRPWMAGEGDGGAAVAPLAGARVWQEPRTAPSSGTSVVPFGGPVRARSEAAARLRWCAGDPVPLFFPSRRRATTVGGDQHGRRPAVVAQQVCPTDLSWLGFVILSVDPIRIEIFLSSSFHSDFFTQKLDLLARSAN